MSLFSHRNRLPPEGPHDNRTVVGALKIVFKYALFAALWIVLSDAVVGLLVKNPERMVAVSILKGSLFVAITSLLLFVLVTRFGFRLAAREEEKAQAELDLTESDQRFATAFQFVPVALSISQIHDARLITVNEAFLRLYGYAREEMEGHTTPELGLWEAGARVEAMAELERGQSLVNRELEGRKKDGSAILVNVSGQRVIMQGVPCFLAVATDITFRKREEEERQRIEAELQHAQKLESLGSLASGVAHDMNNVLAAIQSVSEVMKVTLGGDPRVVRGLDTITKATTRGRNLVKGLTNFARKDLREPEAVDLNGIVREEADLLDHTLLQKVQLAVDLEPGLPPIMGDRGALGNALMNLCVNAVDAMPRGGLLAIRTRSLPTDQVEVVVEDSGEGMAPEVLQRALEPFFTTKPLGKGTGLGLAMVNGIMEAHGGTLSIQSEVGFGTSIRLLFPALPIGPGPVPGAPLAPCEPVRSLALLLVDDDELIRATVPAMLQVYGHRTVTANGGQAALVMLEEGLEVDAVILDLNMPGMSGVEVLAPLRALRPHLPVIIATGYLDPTVEGLLERFDQVYTLAKPFTMKDLEPKLKGLCP